MSLALDDPRVAQLLTDMVDRRVRAAIDGLARIRYGTVAAVDPVTSSASLLLGGSTTPSPGFVYPGGPPPQVGDRVRAVNRGADRYIEDNLSAPPYVGPIVAGYSSGATGNQGSLTTSADITGASLDINVVAGRTYWVYGEALLQSTVATDRLTLELWTTLPASAQLQAARQVTSQTSSVKFTVSDIYVAGVDQLVRFRLRAGRASGTGTVTVVQGTSNPTVLVCVG